MAFNQEALCGLGVIVGMKEEARLFRRFFPSVPIALSHAHEEGAYKAIECLKAAGVKSVLSFGCAGGLSPNLPSGSVILAENIVVKEKENYVSYQTDKGISHCFEAPQLIKGTILHSSHIVPKASDKKKLFEETHSLAVDMESGVAAFSGLPFAVLRVICDDSQKDLPHAACVALVEGKINFLTLFASLLREPMQLPSLMNLGKEAGRARSAMRAYLEQVSGF